jgi:Fur family ferric uptake transcriptional regulator
MEYTVDDQVIRKAGLKVTLPRMKILELLETYADQHLTAQEVHKLLLESDSEIGLATVYHVLTQFEAVGLVDRHHFRGQAIFEINQGQHHDHIVCLDCGHVEEFVDPVIEKRQQAIAKERGFSLREHALILYADCSRNDCPNRGECPPINGVQ